MNYRQLVHDFTLSLLLVLSLAVLVQAVKTAPTLAYRRSQIERPPWPPQDSKPAAAGVYP